MNDRGLESLEVWQKARRLAVYIYREIIPILPPEEKWGLISQMKRAATSVPANIAEGYGRHYFQEGIRFCYQARGSLSELFTHAVIAQDLGYLSNDEFGQAKVKISELRQMLNGYIRYLKGKKANSIREQPEIVYETDNIDSDGLS